MYKTLEQMLMEWSSLIEGQWRRFRDDFSTYLKYYIFEGESMLELARNTSNAEQEYLDRENELAIKKHAMFMVKDFDKWEISPEDRQIFEETTLLHKKKLTFPKMFPQASSLAMTLPRKPRRWLTSTKNTAITSTG